MHGVEICPACRRLCEAAPTGLPEESFRVARCRPRTVESTGRLLRGEVEAILTEPNSVDAIHLSIADGIAHLAGSGQFVSAAFQLPRPASGAAQGRIVVGAPLMAAEQDRSI